MTEREKAQKGYLYDANYDKEIVEARTRCADLCYEFNNLRPSDIEKQQELHVALFLLLFTFSFLNFYLSYRNSSERVTLKSLARCLKLSGVIVCSLSALNVITLVRWLFPST